MQRKQKWIFIAAMLLMAGLGRAEHSEQAQSQDRVFRGASRHELFSGESDGLPELTVRQVLEEANRSFTYRGQPIHPKLVKEFQSLVSDGNPVTLAVDVSAAFDTNEYTDEVDDLSNGMVSFKDEEGRFSYRRSGFKKSEGAHVLETWDGSTGSYVGTSCLWVRFEIGQSFYPDGRPYDQLVMRLVRTANP